MVSSNHQKIKSLTLVIAVYNAVRYLEYILTGLDRQTIKDFEVIVADDGSGPEIGSLVERMANQVSFPIQHLWHEDTGFRKNMMLNRAIGAARTDYLVFIDGDCLPHPEFLRDHWSHRVIQTVLCGRRVNLSQRMTDRITIDMIRNNSFAKISLPLLWDGLAAGSSNLEDGVRLTNAFIRRVLHRNQARILGCNFSLEKDLIERINGFNEDYHAPGIGEDTDIAFRLSLIGAKFSTLRYQAVLFHLYHPVTRTGDSNRKIFEDVERLRQSWCVNGLKKHEKV
jgi:glycosyltransferase involved in cell wall biosynthesis